MEGLVVAEGEARAETASAAGQARACSRIKAVRLASGTHPPGAPTGVMDAGH